MKAINNIIADIRDLAANRDWHNHTNQSNRERLLDIANSIEQAVTNCNQLKMREALEDSQRLFENFAWGDNGAQVREQMRDNQSALSTPPRNCDLHTSRKEAFEEWLIQNSQQKIGVIRWVDFIDWLFTEAKGETK